MDDPTPTRHIPAFVSDMQKKMWEAMGIPLHVVERPPLATLEFRVPGGTPYSFDTIEVVVPDDSRKSLARKLAGAVRNYCRPGLRPRRQKYWLRQINRLLLRHPGLRWLIREHAHRCNPNAVARVRIEE